MTGYGRECKLIVSRRAESAGYDGAASHRHGDLSLTKPTNWETTLSACGRHFSRLELDDDHLAVKAIWRSSNRPTGLGTGAGQGLAARS